MEDRFDAPAVTDFPTDAVVHYDFLFWLTLTVALIVLASIITVVFKNAHRDAASGTGNAIQDRVKAVMKALSVAAKAGPDEQIDKAVAGREAVSENFGATLALSNALNKAVGKLNTAIDGTKEEVYVAKGIGAGQVTGGTVINIAVNAGDGQPQALAGPYAAPAAAVVTAPADKVPMTADEKSESIWKAVQKLFNYWKNLSAVTAAFRAAQAQLMSSPAWEDPREEAAAADLFKLRK